MIDIVLRITQLEYYYSAPCFQPFGLTVPLSVVLKEKRLISNLHHCGILYGILYGISEEYCGRNPSLFQLGTGGRRGIWSFPLSSVLKFSRLKQKVSGIPRSPVVRYQRKRNDSLISSSVNN